MTGGWHEEIVCGERQEARSYFGEEGRNRTCRAGCIDFGLYFKCSKKQSGHLEQGTDMIWFTF